MKFSVNTTKERQFEFFGRCWCGSHAGFSKANICKGVFVKTGSVRMYDCAYSLLYLGKCGGIIYIGVYLVCVTFSSIKRLQPIFCIFSFHFMNETERENCLFFSF